jgi:hypothetical protein
LIVSSFDKILEKIPRYEKYLDVEELDRRSEELAREFPSSVKLMDLGKTAGGERILALSVGNGPHAALLYGYPNPEEPLGGLLLDYFSRALAEDDAFLESTGYTWYMIKCADPDGAKLNRKYPEGPYTPINFARNFYRTPNRTTGWLAFPYRYGEILNLNSPTPETIAMMKIMDGRRIDLMCGLHLLRFGGVTFQVSENCPELYAPFQMLARRNYVPLRNRPGTMLASGIQLGHHLTPAGNYVRAVIQGRGPLPQISGARMIEYERLINPNCFDLVPESSMWYDPRCYDDSPGDATLGEALTYAAKAESETNEVLLKVYQNVKSSLSAKTKFLDMVEDFVTNLVGRYYNIFDPPVPVPENLKKETASVAQKVETEGRADIYYSPCYVSMMIRAIDAQLEVEGGDVLRNAREELSRKMEELGHVFDSKYDCRHYPLRNLIAMNLGSVLYAADYAAKRNGPFQMWH